MTHHTKICLIALLLGLIPLGVAGLSYWVGEALATPPRAPRIADRCQKTQDGKHQESTEQESICEPCR